MKNGRYSQSGAAGALALGVLLLCWPTSGAAQNEGCISVPCDGLASCPAYCPDFDPGWTPYPSEDGLEPLFTESPGGSLGLEAVNAKLTYALIAGWIPMVVPSYFIPKDWISQQVSELPQPQSQAALPGELYDEAFERRTAPFGLPDWIEPVFVEVPTPQGQPMAPKPSGERDEGEYAAHLDDPINPANGELVIREVDLSFPGFGVPYAHVRRYGSRTSYDGPLGQGWDHSYNRRLVVAPEATPIGPVLDPVNPWKLDVAYDELLVAASNVSENSGGPSAATSCGPLLLLTTGQGSVLRFREIFSSDEAALYDSETHLELRGDRDGDTMTWRLLHPDGLVERFDERGLLVAMEDSTEVGLRFGWEAAGSDWRLAVVTDSVGRTIVYQYDAAGRLARVAEEDSGLEASYEYDARGDLIRATDSTGRSERYEYDFDTAREPGDWLPEAKLQRACDLACAPTVSSCDAGGACDAPVQEALRQCNATCGTCADDCYEACAETPDGPCDVACSGEIKTADGGNCKDECLSSCDLPGTKIAILAQCQQWFEEGGSASVAALCSSCETSCELLDSSCGGFLACVSVADDGSFDEGSTGQCLADNGFLEGAEDVAFVTAVIGNAVVEAVECGLAAAACSWHSLCDHSDNCSFAATSAYWEAACDQDYRRCCRDGSHCAAESCNAGRNCASDCRDAFYGTQSGNTCPVPDPYREAQGLPLQTVDEFTATRGCIPRLQAACAPNCEFACKGACLEDCSGVCRSECDAACDVGDCASYCDSLDLAGACQDGCVAGCVDEAHQNGPFVGPKFGQPTDLNHNLVRAYDGNGDLYLENEYETDIASPDFDRVIDQRFGTWTIGFASRDLAGEAAGTTPAATGLAATELLGPGEFVPVDICPMSCTQDDTGAGSMEYVPWSGALLGFSAGNELGGLKVTSQSGAHPVPPTRVLLTRARSSVSARSVSEMTGQPTRRRAFDLLLPEGTVRFTPSGRQSWNVRGPAAALNGLVAHRELTVLTDSGGVLRVYPGHPATVLGLADGSCHAPFVATSDGPGVSVAPTSACSEVLATTPMATAVDDLSLAATRNLFSPSPLLPLRGTVSWRPGRSSDHRDPSAAPLSRGSLATAGVALRVSRTPLAAPRGSAGYAFHVDAAADIVSDQEMAPPEGAGCLPVPGPAVRGDGPVAARASVIVDGYGESHEFYFDEGGRLLRTVDPTGAARSLQYDSRGALIGMEEASGARTCLRRGDVGQVLDAWQLPAQGLPGDDAPIWNRYTYQSSPLRVVGEYDPRSAGPGTAPDVLLRSYTYDDRGRLITAELAPGESTTFEYPASGPGLGYPERRIDPDGAITSFAYDLTSGTLSSVTEDVGGADRTVESLSDSAGRPVWMRSPLGAEQTFVWESNRLASVTTTADGRSTMETRTYDQDGQLRTRSRGRLRQEHGYAATGTPEITRRIALDGSAQTAAECSQIGPDLRLIERVGPEGERLEIEYDGAGRPLSVSAGVWPSSGAWDDACEPLYAAGPPAIGDLLRFEYDAAGRLVSKHEASGARSTLRYDGHDRVIEVEDGGGTIRRVGYDALGLILWAGAYAPGTGGTYHEPVWGETGLLAAEVYEYDAAGRVIEHSLWHADASGQPVGDGASTTRYTYDVAGRRREIIDDAGAVTTLHLDGLGRTVRTDLPTGDFVQVQHSADGLSQDTTWSAPTASGFLGERLELTQMGVVERTLALAGGQAVETGRWVRNDEGLVTHEIAPGQGTSELRYDAFGRLVERLESHGPTTERLTLGLDRSGRVLEYTSDSGSQVATTTFLYDALGRISTVTDPVGGRVTTSYYGASPLPGIRTDELGVEQHHSYAHGLLGRIRTVVPGSPEASQSRDFWYDDLGRLTTARMTGDMPSWAPSSVFTSFTWDTLGNRTSESVDAFGQGGYVEHDYDGLGRPVASSFGGVAVFRAFDALSRLRMTRTRWAWAEDTYAGLGGPVERALSNGLTESYDYDPLNRLSRTSIDAPASNVGSWRYDIPLDGTPRAMTVGRFGALQSSSVYQLDESSRLQGETHQLPPLASPLVEWPESTASANGAASKWTAQSNDFWLYGLDGRHNWNERTGAEGAVAATHDVDDALVEVGGQAISYDARGSHLSGGELSLTYDSFGQVRSAKGGGEGREYVRDALGRVVLERDRHGLIRRYAYDGQRRALWLEGAQMSLVVDGADIDEHLFELHPNGDVLFFHQGRTKDVHVLTDDTGAPVEWHEYDAYGGELITDGFGSSVLPPGQVRSRYGFQGHVASRGLGLVEMRARLYRPDWGRFLTRDPAGLADGSNLYAFVGGAPLTFRDPLGLGRIHLTPPDVEHISYGDVLLGHCQPPGACRELYDHLAQHTPNLLDWNFGTGRPGFLRREVFPRVGGGVKMLGGGAGFWVGAKLTATGVGATVGVPLAAWGADYGGSGLSQLVNGKPAKTALHVAGNAAGLDGQRLSSIQEDVVLGAGLAYPLARTLKAVVPAASAAGGAAETSTVLLRTPKQLQAKFKHAKDFGVPGNYSKANAAAFSRAIHQHINSPGVRAIRGTYHKRPVTHFVNPSSGLNVIVDPAGTFISGWRLSPAQLQNVLTHGGL